MNLILFAKIMIAVSVLVFLVGLIKPKWVLFWMKEPDRLIATTVGLFMFMGSVTGFSELTVKHRPKGEVEKPKRSIEDQNELQLDRQ